MWIEIKQTNTRYVRAKTLNAGIKKAKKSLRIFLGNKIYREVITDVEAKVIPDNQMVVPVKQVDS